jgi:antirestriction protein ArdC
MSDNQKLNVYDRVTQKIIADLEQGVRPWQKPWSGDNAAPRIVRPRRHNGEHYNGVNILLLWDAAITNGFQNPTWMTFKQAEEYGAHVRKGEKSSFVVYANKLIKTETNSKTGDDIEREIPFMRGYNVFNVEQIEELPEKFYCKPESLTTSPSFSRIENVEHFIRNTGATIRHGGDRAYYAEGSDHIQMPFIDAFRDGESYYATVAHEVTHWTKHKDRLNRDFGRVVWGDEGYAKEELVAEIGSAFLCADLGITPEIRDDHAAYIESWLKALKNDKKLIFSAAAHATRAVEYLKSKQPVIAPDAKPEDRNGIAIYNTLHVSEPMQIGKHLWRLRIERSGKGLQTRCEFQDESGSFWLHSQEWKNYDTNDTSSGLPKGLRKLFERERSMLEKHGLATQTLASRQLSLTL